MAHKQKLFAYSFFNNFFQATVGLYAYGAVWF